MYFRSGMWFLWRAVRLLVVNHDTDARVACERPLHRFPEPLQVRLVQLAEAHLFPAHDERDSAMVHAHAVCCQLADEHVQLAHVDAPIDCDVDGWYRTFALRAFVM